MYTLRDMYIAGDMYRGTCGGSLACENGLMCRLVVVQRGREVSKCLLSLEHLEPFRGAV